MCGCPMNSYQWAGMWTNAGQPAHVHKDGSTGGGGPDGCNDGDTRFAAQKLIAVGWIARGWV